MPIYGFTCAQCGHQFDRLQKVDAADPTTCPECGQPALHRQLSAPAVRLAGQGWYETDFKPKDQQRHVVHAERPAVDSKSEVSP